MLLFFGVSVYVARVSGYQGGRDQQGGEVVCLCPSKATKDLHHRVFEYIFDIAAKRSR